MTQPDPVNPPQGSAEPQDSPTPAPQPPPPPSPAPSEEMTLPAGAAPAPPPLAPAAWAVGQEPVAGPRRPGEATPAGRMLAGVLLALAGFGLGVAVTLIATHGDSDSPAALPSSAAAPSVQASASATPDASAPAVTSAQVQPANTEQGAMVLGNAKAPLRFRVYLDYLCPFCKEFENAAAQQLHTWIGDGTVAVEFRPIAILDRMTSTGYSTRAVMASAAVRDLAPASWEAYHTSLFAAQPAEGGAGLDDATLAQIAGKVGAPAQKVAEALADGRYRKWAELATQAALEGPDKVQGTPTVVLVDTATGKSSPVSNWDAAGLREAVAAAQAKK